MPRSAPAPLLALGPLLLGLGGFGLAIQAGCQPAGDAAEAIQQHRARLLLSDEPEGAVTAVDLREQEGGFERGDVVLVGQVGGIPNPWTDAEQAFPWVDGEATFFMVDPATAAELADHATDDPDHHQNCPFCARALEKSVDAIATVTFSGEDGKPLPYGASPLLGIEENDVVVVRGVGRVLGGGLLVVEANGVYVRR